MTIIGVIADVHNQSPEVAVVPQVYEAFLQRTDSEGLHNLAIRSTLPPDALASALHIAVHSIDSTIPVEEVHLMSGLLPRAQASRRFQTTLLTVFSAIAMPLAVIGLYGLLTYSVRRRTGEIGIRMALGASRAAVSSMRYGRSTQ